MSEVLSEPAKLLLLLALLAKDGIISNNSKAFLKGKRAGGKAPFLLHSDEDAYDT
jgi:hypothetical protein